MVIYVPGTEETDPKKQNMSLQQLGAAVTTNTASIAALQTANVASSRVTGTTTNDNATAGNIGEYVESIVTSGSAVAITTATAKTVTSISLTAGDWDVNGLVYIAPAATTSVTQFITSISLVTNTLDVTPGRVTGITIPATVTTAAFSTSLAPYRFSLNATTTIFLIGQATFTVSTAGAYGIIRARRVR